MNFEPFRSSARLLTSVAVFAALLATSCSYVDPARISNPETLHGARTIYLVLPDKDTRNVDESLIKALSKRGFAVSSGPVSQKPADVDLYVEFVGVFRWDMGVYMESLDVSVYDNKTAAKIAQGNFHQGAFHDFPNTEQTVDRVIDTIFGSGAAKAPS